MQTQKYSSGTKWEPLAGYSRAIKSGNIIHVSGTTSTNEMGEIIHTDDYYLQTIKIIANIKKALEYFGASLENVVRTRIYVIDISNWELVAKAHGESFSSIMPATSMVEVSALISPDCLVEIEAEAHI